MMKRLFLMLAVMCSLGSLHAQQIRVALFQGHGGAETCVWETLAALEMDKSIQAECFPTYRLTPEVLSQYDVVVIPGGGGSRQYLNMGGKGRAVLQQFVENGGGVVGICAGAYLLSSTPNYACLEMSGAQAHDIEHDNRGRGVARVTLTEEGQRLFPELKPLPELFIMYYEGPVALQNPISPIHFTSLATMESDVHVEGNAPANMTNGKTFLYQNSYGKGRVMSVVGHPEATPGMQWMISRLVHAVSPKQVEPQLDPKFIATDRFGCEILMDKERREVESKNFEVLLYGSAKDKIVALQWLIAHNSWDAKRWIQGLIHDADPEVRQAAAQNVAWAMYRMYLPDLRTALQREENPAAREAQLKAIAALQ